MTKFCTNCGKELIDGKCDCVKKSDVGVTSDDLASKFMDIVKGLLKKPVTTIKENTTEDNFSFGLILLAISACVTGLFTYFFIKDGSSVISFVRLYGMFDVPFLRVFIASSITSAIWYAVLGFVTYLFANKLFKLEVTVKEIFTMLGILSVIMSLALIVSIILVYVSVKLMLLLIVVASLFYSIYFILGLKEVTGIDKDKLAYLYVPSILTAVFIVYYVLPRLLNF